VLHLVDRLVAHDLPEALVAPVFAHARVDEVLVDRRELVGEDFVQQIDDLGLSLHPVSPSRGARINRGSRGARVYGRESVRTIAAAFGRVVVGEHAKHDGTARAARAARAAPIGDLVDGRRSLADAAADGGIGDGSTDADVHVCGDSFVPPLFTEFENDLQQH
jgi:hypothetical protein